MTSAREGREDGRAGRFRKSEGRYRGVYHAPSNLRKNMELKSELWRTSLNLWKESQGEYKEGTRKKRELES